MNAKARYNQLVETYGRLCKAASRNKLNSDAMEKLVDWCHGEEAAELKELIETHGFKPC